MVQSRKRFGRIAALAASYTLLSGLIIGTGNPAALAEPAPQQPSGMDSLVPRPANVEPDPDTGFELDRSTRITVPRGGKDARTAAKLLAGELRPATGYRLPVVSAPGGRGISLRLTGNGRGIGAQGYRLDVAERSVRLRATTVEGLRNGVQTLLQLLPAAIEEDTVQSGPWTIPGGSITDKPRYPYRGVLLDVARYFYPVDFVKRYIDQAARYKYNHLHLHLTDDQGWRIEINGWERLTSYGGSTETGGGEGGYYTQEEYREIVRYAQRRNVTVVPEIDVPGHTTAALASYPELNCDGTAPPLYTGVDVGFSSLCLDKDITYEFLDDVVGDVARMTPGKYLHIGGDEVPADVPEADYADFVRRATGIVADHGKEFIGWHDFLAGAPAESAIAQYWYPWPDNELSEKAAADGAKFIMSPADHAYLDMMYNESEPQAGQSWAGFVEVRDAYEWDPETTITGVGGASVLGFEATMFTQVTPTEESIEYMAFPRMPVLAEVGWTPKADQAWRSIRRRLPEQAHRWDIWGVDYYRSPQVKWT